MTNIKRPFLIPHISVYGTHSPEQIFVRSARHFVSAYSYDNARYNLVALSEHNLPRVADFLLLFGYQS